MPSAQNTTAAAVTATPTTAPLQIGKTIIKVEEVVEEAAGLSLRSVAGVIGFIFASSQKTANEQQDTIQGHGKKDSAEPEPAAASGGQGVRGGKKDRSGQGNVDQLEGLQQHQQNTTKAGGYRISDKKSKQNIDNANKKIKSLEDVENQ
jgi:hypothetical protein